MSELEKTQAKSAEIDEVVSELLKELRLDKGIPVPEEVAVAVGGGEGMG